MVEDNQKQRASIDRWIVAKCPEVVIFKCFDSTYIQPLGVTRDAYFRFQLGVNDSEKQNNRAARITLAETPNKSARVSLKTLLTYREQRY
jgi:hypothetical protein